MPSAGEYQASRSFTTSAGKCSCLSSPWDGQLAHSTEFYNGLTVSSRNHLDVTAGGAFLSKTVKGAVDLIEKIVSNMSCSEEHLQTHQHGMHTVKETKMLAAKLDLLMKKLDDQEKNNP